MINELNQAIGVFRFLLGAHFREKKIYRTSKERKKERKTNKRYKRQKMITSTVVIWVDILQGAC